METLAYLTSQCHFASADHEKAKSCAQHRSSVPWKSCLAPCCFQAPCCNLKRLQPAQEAEFCVEHQFLHFHGVILKYRMHRSTLTLPTPKRQKLAKAAAQWDYFHLRCATTALACILFSVYYCYQAIPSTQEIRQSLINLTHSQHCVTSTKARTKYAHTADNSSRCVQLHTFHAYMMALSIQKTFTHFADGNTERKNPT